jgi:hypothetical protein
MNSMYGSPEFARFVAQRLIQDRITDAQSRAVAGRHGKRRGTWGTPSSGRTPTKHRVTWLPSPLRPAH